LIHLLVLFEMQDVFMYPLFLIYNKCLKSGVLPSEWKFAVTAIHKKAQNQIGTITDPLV